MIKKIIKILLIGILSLAIGLTIPFFNTEATIIDAYNCQVFHSGSGRTCTNSTFGYAFEGGGEFANNFIITYTGKKSSIHVNKVQYYATKVSKGTPYYIDSWISAGGKTTRYTPAASRKFLSTSNKLSFAANRTLNLKGNNAMLRIHSNYSGGYGSVNYDITTIPK